MRRYYILLIGTLAAACATYAQQLTGRVVDTQNQPIEFANVALYALPDSSLVTGTITDADGDFTLEGGMTKRALLKISFVGYETQMVEARPGVTVTLKPESTQLAEVTVRANRPAIRLKNDALVASVQGSMLSQAGTANDVLRRLPSLTADSKGNISVFGKGEAKIYINHREVRDLSELDQLNSADIRDVEIVRNPGARYEASVKAVIRINTVRHAGDGFGFDARSSWYKGETTDLREQLNVNWRKSGWDVFGTVLYGRGAYLIDSRITQQTRLDTLWQQENALYATGVDRWMRITAGTNWEISPKHYVGLRYTLSPTLRDDINHTTFNSMVHADSAFYDEWHSDNARRTTNDPAHRLNAYYNGTVGRLGIDFNVDFYTSGSTSRSHAVETSRMQEDRVVNSENRVRNRIAASKLILSYPVFGGELSVGGEYVRTHRTDMYSNPERIVPSSDMTADEWNSSLFAEYARETPIGQFGVGLRYEHVRSDYLSDGRPLDGLNRSYNQWFPNVSFGTRVKGVDLQLAYTAKTQRPSYRQLTSNVYYANRLTLQTGNPLLKPTLTHDVSLTASWRIVQLTASYRQERDAVIDRTERSRIDPKVSLITYTNLDRLPLLTAFATVTPTFGVWTPQLSAGFIKQWAEVEIDGQPVRYDRPIFRISLNNSLRLPAGLLFTLDVRYRSKGDERNLHLTDDVWVVNMGLTRSFFSDRLSVMLRGWDVFRGEGGGAIYRSPRMESYQVDRYDSQEFELTLRYRFNAVKSKYKGTGAGTGELERL